MRLPAIIIVCAVAAAPILVLCAIQNPLGNSGSTLISDRELAIASIVSSETILTPGARQKLGLVKKPTAEQETAFRQYLADFAGEVYDNAKSQQADHNVDAMLIGYTCGVLTGEYNESQDPDKLAWLESRHKGSQCEKVDELVKMVLASEGKR